MHMQTVRALSILILLSASLPSAAAVWYVNQANTSGTHDGASWATALSTIQAGVLAAGAAGGGEVWVAQGEYIEYVTLQSNVSLLGGFSGNENSAE